MIIREARPGEEQEVLEFYNQLIDQMQNAQYPIRWKKGIYPVLSDISNAVYEGAMYVAEEENSIMGAFIINHMQGEGYDLADWKITAEKEKVAVIHLLATLPAFQGRGLGRKMLEKAVEICRNKKDAVIRLDTLPWNVPGKKLYERFGFSYCTDVELNYPSTGKLSFSMYEFEL